MEIQETMPKEGQFVAVWSFGGVPWSGIYLWKGGELFVYNAFDDAFLPEDCDCEFLLNNGSKYMITTE